MQLPLTIVKDGLLIGRHTVISFNRTLRIPEDGKRYNLPAGFGRLPILRVEDVAERVPEKWNREGGVIIPLYQREALFIEFSGVEWRPTIAKVSVGRINAVTGQPHDLALKPGRQDYVVIPVQKWLDGINNGNNTVRQFVAMPLGHGYTVEAQITDEEAHGGFQLAVFDPKKGRFSEPETQPWEADSRNSTTIYSGRDLGPDFGMGIAAGGSIKQQIFEDSYGIDTWDAQIHINLAVHIVNSEVYSIISGKSPAPTPITSDAYATIGLPWYDYYEENRRTIAGPSVLRRVLSVFQIENARNKDLEADTPTFDKTPTTRVRVLTLPEHVKTLQQSIVEASNNKNHSECLVYARMCAELIDRHLDELSRFLPQGDAALEAAKCFSIASECAIRTENMELAEELANRSLNHRFSEKALVSRLYARARQGHMEKADEDARTLIDMTSTGISGDQITQFIGFQMAEIGNLGNPPNLAGKGAIDYNYWITRQLITNIQYLAFLNSVDPEGTNPNHIYNPAMKSPGQGGVVFNRAARRGSMYNTFQKSTTVFCVRWGDAARFCNWLHNGSPSFTKSEQSVVATENGSYSLQDNGDGLTGIRKQDARWWIPNSDEWIKSLSYDPTKGKRTYNPNRGKRNNYSVAFLEGASVDSYYKVHADNARLHEWHDDPPVSSSLMRSGSWAYCDASLYFAELLEEPENGFPNVGFRVATNDRPVLFSSYDALLNCISTGSKVSVTEKPDLNREFIKESIAPIGMFAVTGGILHSFRSKKYNHVDSFCIGSYPVTSSEWSCVCEWANQNSYDLLCNVASPNSLASVTSVNWINAVKWCNAKSEKEQLKPVYHCNSGVFRCGEERPRVDIHANGYRLPTVLEWEWAGGQGASGHGLKTGFVSLLSDKSGQSESENAENGIINVGDNTIKCCPARPWCISICTCLHDMAMWEWCWDSHGKTNRRIFGGKVSTKEMRYSLCCRNSANPKQCSDQISVRLACNLAR